MQLMHSFLTANRRKNKPTSGRYPGHLVFINKEWVRRMRPPAVLMQRTRPEMALSVACAAALGSWRDSEKPQRHVTSVIGIARTGLRCQQAAHCGT